MPGKNLIESEAVEGNNCRSCQLNYEFKKSREGKNIIEDSKKKNNEAGNHNRQIFHDTDIFVDCQKGKSADYEGTEDSYSS